MTRHGPSLIRCVVALVFSLPRFDPLSVYVANLRPSVKDVDLKALFSSCGEVVSAVIGTNIHGESKGWGVVTFAAEVRCFSRVGCVRRGGWRRGPSLMCARAPCAFPRALQGTLPAALALTGTELDGAPVNVQPAKQKVHEAKTVVRAEAPKSFVPPSLYEPPFFSCQALFKHARGLLTGSFVWLSGVFTCGPPPVGLVVY
jgi:RNA recognition motif-containing protein